MSPERGARRSKLRSILERAHTRYMALDLDSPEIGMLEVLICQIEGELDALYRADEIESAWALTRNS